MNEMRSETLWLMLLFIDNRILRHKFQAVCDWLFDAEPVKREYETLWDALRGKKAWRREL